MFLQVLAFTYLKLSSYVKSHAWLYISFPLSFQCLWGKKTRGIKWQQRQICQGIHTWIYAESFSIYHANCSMPALNSESLSLHLHTYSHTSAAAQGGCDLSPCRGAHGKHPVCVCWGAEESRSLMASHLQKITNQFHICKLKITGSTRSDTSINF